MAVPEVPVADVAEPPVGRRPVLTLGPRQVAAVAAASALVAGLTALRPVLPTSGNRWWELVQQGLVVETARSLPSWWTTALFLFVAAAAGAAAVTAGRAGRRTRRVAWFVVAACAAWMSFDHALAVHDQLKGPLGGPIGAHPVEVGLFVLIVPAGAVLAAGSGWLHRVLLGSALLCYVAGEVAVGRGLVVVAPPGHLTALVEAVLGWAGLLALALVAARER